MVRLFGLGVGIGAGIQAFRNWPPDGTPSARTAIAIAVVAILSAWFGGRRRHGAVAVASAEATAVASNTVNLAVVVPGQGAGSALGSLRVPVESETPWLGGPRAQITADDLDGLDVSEVLADGGEPVESPG